MNSDLTRPPGGLHPSFDGTYAAPTPHAAALDAAVSILPLPRIANALATAFD